MGSERTVAWVVPFLKHFVHFYAAELLLKLIFLVSFSTDMKKYLPGKGMETCPSVYFKMLNQERTRLFL